MVDVHTLQCPHEVDFLFANISNGVMTDLLNCEIIVNES